MYWKNGAWHGPVRPKKPLGSCDAKVYFQKHYGAEKIMIAAPNWEKL